MSSLNHQWLVLWVARKMAADGYTVRGYDGPTPQGGTWNGLPRSPIVGRFRPDAWGIACACIALGEAKTAEDVNTAHTIDQLRAFCSHHAVFGYKYGRLYVAVPRSAARALDRVIAKAGLSGARHVYRVHIPNCLLEDPRE